MAPRPLKRLKRFVRHYLMRALIGLVGLLPLRAALALGEALGRFFFRVSTRERAKALNSLLIAYPDRDPVERYALARRSFAFFGRVLAELCLHRRIDSRFRAYIELPEADHRTLRDALAEGHGVIFVTGHVGNFELLARRIGMEGYPCQTIAQQSSDRRTTAFIERMRLRGGVKTIWRGAGRTGPAMQRALAEREILGLVIDVDTRGRGHFVDFFGRKAYTTRAAADLALRSGAAVLAGFIHARPDGGHRVDLTRIPVNQTGDLEADSLALTQTMTSAIEQAIRRSPACWTWTHQRWKTRPPEENQASPARPTCATGS